jgi:CysZ protein
MHGSQVVGELLVVGLFELVAVLVAGAILAAVVLLDVAVGGVLLTRGMSKRRLAWLLPLGNFALYVLVVPLLARWIWNEPIAVGDLFRMPHVQLTAIMAAALTGLGWIAVAMLVPIDALRRGLARAPTATGDRLLAAYLAVPEPRGVWAKFREGFSAAGYGLAYWLHDRTLWKHALLPLAINLLITLAVLALLIVGVVATFRYLQPSFPAGLQGVFVGVVTGLILLIVALALSAVLAILLQSILFSYFAGRMARVVELRLGATPEELVELSFVAEAADGARDAAWLVTINLALLLLHLVPGIGSLVSLALGWYVNCQALGAGYLDFPLSLRGWRRRERRGFARRHLPQTLGLGTAALAGTLVPVLGAVLLLGAVVGAVLLHRRLAARSDAR